MNQLILEKAKLWATDSYFDQADRQEIQDLIEANNEKELTERFYKNLEFGTGGMRSILGVGENRINKYTIRKATKALADVVLKHHAPMLAKGQVKNSKPSVAISYDSRRFSVEFAHETASVLAAYGVHSYIFKRLNPVSFLSFSIRHHGCMAGVMITASHNPPEYNGYKAFWADGAQVTPPQDEEIIAGYNALNDLSKIKRLDFSEAQAQGLIHWVGEDVEDLFIHHLLETSLNLPLCKEKGSQLKIVYTPIHGSGRLPVSKILSAYGFTDVHVIKEQEMPDGNFPTVTSPNPENASALKMAVDKMLETKADLAIGTDPDADRIGVAVLGHDQKTVTYLSGNQLGILMLHYILSNLKKQNRMPPLPYFVQSIVTTPLQEKIAANFGVTTERTLTGFKWICGKMAEIEQTNPKRSFVFGTEESFGYLNHSYARDKDATGPMGLLCEMALYYKLQNKNFLDALEDIYNEFGFSQEDLLNLVYEGKEGSEKIGRIMANFRGRYGYKKDIHFAGHEIVRIEDYESSLVVNTQTGESTKIHQPESNVLGFFFTDGNALYMRPSGTEPKIKFYSMIAETEGSLPHKISQAQMKTKNLLDFIKQEADRA